jgi:hypothetical protein
MLELLGAFKEYLLWSAIVWVLFFVAFAAMFARGQLSSFARGIGRVLLSILTSPFIFLRKAVGAVLGFTHDEEQQARASNQYLLNKALLVLQAIVIVIAISALSAGVVMTWNAWVPPAEIRKDASEYAKKVDQQAEETAAAAKSIETLDAEWTQKQEPAVARYRKARQAELAAASRDLTRTEQEIATYGSQYTPGTFTEIKNTVAQRSNESYYAINETKERIDRIVNYQYWLGDWDRGALRRWNAAWHNKTVAAFQLANLSIDDLRNAEQPSYAQAKVNRDATAERLGRMQELLKEKKELASLKWKAAFWRALASFFTFLMFVWFAGAIIEAAWLAIRIADDVRQIRERGSAAEESLAVAEPRLPLRDVDASQARLSPPATA